MIEWVPAFRSVPSDAVLNVVWPPESVPVPSVVEPSLNVTIPLGVPNEGDTGVTIAVNVTVSP